MTIIVNHTGDLPLTWPPTVSKGLSPWMASQVGGLYGGVVPLQSSIDNDALVCILRLG